jgi:hypothetical protein
MPLLGMYNYKSYNEEHNQIKTSQELTDFCSRVAKSNIFLSLGVMIVRVKKLINHVYFK